MRFLAGTSGYSYPEWKGRFYPAGMRADAMLAHYAAQLPAVELNNTFYRMPRAADVEAWRDSVPAGFRFAVKASRRISHQARLVDAGDAVTHLLGRVRLLGERLACVLVQLPPFQRRDLPRLRDFQSLLPADVRFAFEFRHASWLEEETFAALSAAGHSLCVSDDGELPLPAQLATSELCYLRLRRPGYDDASLAAWIEGARASGATTTLAFFKHEDDAGGPPLAQRFLALAAGSG